MYKVACPYCGYDGMQVGFCGVKVASTNCSVLSKEARLTVKLSGGVIRYSADILCPRCSNVLSVEATRDPHEPLAKDIRAVFPNLKVMNNSDRQTLFIDNNTLTAPYHTWQVTLGPRQMTNYTQSPDFYMAFIERTDPSVTLENMTGNLVYEANVYRSGVGAFVERRALIPVGYHGDHDWTVNLDARDGIRLMAYSINSFLLKNEAISFADYLSDAEVPDVDQKLSEIIKRITK